MPSPAATCPPWKSLEGKVVLVTGASSGIGRDICLDLATAGCHVVAAARRVEELKKLCDQINGQDRSDRSISAVRYDGQDGSDGGISAVRCNGQDRSDGGISAVNCSSDQINGQDRSGGGISAVRCMGVWLDVSKEERLIEEAVKKAWDCFGRIDGLVNNAGIRDKVYSVLDWPESKWNALLNTNLTGTYLVTKHVCRLMRAAKLKCGSVVNISSIGGIQRGHLPGGVAYTGSKSGITSISKVMALELGEYNIRVNTIAPGLFKSEITAGLLERDWLQRVCERTTPLKTYGTSNPAITSLVRYLIHDSSGYVSGNTFIVDAGVTLPGVPIFSSL